MTGHRRKRSQRSMGTADELDPATKSRRGLSKVAKCVRKCDTPTNSDSCQKCASIDFEAIFMMDRKSIPSEGTAVFDMGPIPLASIDSECSFCRMITTILMHNRLRSHTMNNDSIPCYLRVFSCLSALCLARTKLRLNLSPSLVLAAIPSDWHRDISISMRDSSLAAGLILPTVNVSGNVSQSQHLWLIGRHIAADAIDYGILKTWLEECGKSHPFCSRATETINRSDNVDVNTSQELLVIDCETRMMTRLPIGASYVVMSYVWGSKIDKSSIAIVQEGQKLPAPQPQTIEDVITVTSKLGQRYLWLDRFSINQTDEAAKQQAILEMAEIFEGSNLAIVSLLSDVNSGLPGVSSAHRRLQPCAATQSLHLMSSGIVLEDVLRGSAWSKRGWTLQEALLSRRMLLFSETQVYWKCLSITERECVIQPGAAHAGRRKLALAFSPDIFSEANQYRKRFGEMSLPLYARQVAEYTKRELSYSSDALSAFRALLSRSRETTFYGVPIFMTQASKYHIPELNDDGFVLGLLWSRTAHQWYKPWKEFGRVKHLQTGSRDGFPSWSWTSTYYCVQFDPISFSRELSDRHGQLYACTYPHSPYVESYVTIEVQGHGSVVKAIQSCENGQKTTATTTGSAKRTIESYLPSSLVLTGLISAWQVDQAESLNSTCSFNVLFRHDSSLQLRPTNSWFKQGTLFLDAERSTEVVNETSFQGSAILLVNYRRYGYNWFNVAWWMAIRRCENGWHRIGLIRSVNEVQTPILPAKDSHSEADREHRRPFLRMSLGESHSTYHIPQREDMARYFEKIELL